ncbi:Trans-aconitate 2-methyltransferase [uncultured Ruminococcus sp.]|uniref:methyltransferase domain-containing protein n=1 Tax=Massiliimalia timonensis TaxID=1987501 RepID=UPI0008219A9E|nr:methyltransferase domain-containing protein [Massiliimalia timonensis]SCH63929.1 Trans-aconitate 2-methyltransferase [uncultured Clostridium sp.]SCH78743.1 Trans-aconitate 2-methyltransferase [uncultured Ruminococcus sp.]
MSDWSSSQYLKFKSQRTQPAIDLANRITASSPSNILDVGCGPGNSSQVLKQRFPNASVLGIDSSEDMIRSASQTYRDIEFRLCDAQTELPGLHRTFDVVFSNACLQWIPDHPRLIPSLMEQLVPGGCLAVQIPMNEHEPIHQIIQKIASSPEWKPRFPNPRIFYTLSPGGYFDLLSKLTRQFDLWQTTYFHIMSSHQDILEWYRGTGLRPYLSVLSQPDQASFESQILKELQAAYPKQENGEIIFHFPRFFFLAVKE